MNRKQRMLYRSKEATALKNSYKAFFLALIILLNIVGLGIWMNEAESVAITCQKQTVFTTPTYNQCVANQYESNGDK